MHQQLMPNVEILSEPGPFRMADDWYQYATPDHFWIQWRFSAILRLLQDLDVGERLIEIGCGTGVARHQLEQHFQRPVEGCDLNPKALSSATQGKGGLYLYNVHDRRPDWKAVFNCVFLLDTLEHIPDAVTFLESIRFHLKTNGLLVVNVPAVQALYSRYDKLAGHVKRYRQPLLAGELDEAGFRLIRSSYWGLTMLPVAMLRKILLKFVKAERVLSIGFQPASRFTDSILRFLMAAEMLLLRRPCCGTSLTAVAQRVD